MTALFPHLTRPLCGKKIQRSLLEGGKLSDEQAGVNVQPRHSCCENDLMFDRGCRGNLNDLPLKVMAAFLLHSLVLRNVDHEEAWVAEHRIIKSRAQETHKKGGL